MNEAKRNHESAVTLIKRSELPLACPTKTMPLWSNHPKVYLPITKEEKVTCPYCGQTYQLED